MKDKDVLMFFRRLNEGLEELLEQSPIYYRRALTSVFLSSLATWGLVFVNIYVMYLFPDNALFSSIAPYLSILFLLMPFLAGVLPVYFYALKHTVSRVFSILLGISTVLLIVLELLLFKFTFAGFIYFGGWFYSWQVASVVSIMAGIGSYETYRFFKRKNEQDSKVHEL